MAAGDVVNEINAAATTWINFQPAVSVEICVTSVYDTNRMTDGVILTANYGNAATNLNTKIMLTNSIYFQYYGNVDGAGFNGIQIK